MLNKWASTIVEKILGENEQQRRSPQVVEDNLGIVSSPVQRMNNHTK